MRILMLILAVFLMGVRPGEDHGEIAWPDVGTESGAFGRCSTGAIKGWDFDDASGKYGSTCGNYNWSGSAGYIDCVCTVDVNEGPDNCTATRVDTGAAYTGDDVGACLYDGQRIKVAGFQPDLMMAIDSSRKNGGEIYLPAGFYLMEGCGDDLDGTGITCPLVNQDGDETDRWERIQNATQRVRMVQVTGNRRVIGQPSAAEDPRIAQPSGTVIMIDTGHEAGTPSPTVDRNGDGVSIGVTPLNAGYAAAARICSVPDANGVCDFDATGNSPTFGAVGIYARPFALLGDLAIGDDDMTVCIEDLPLTKGVCQGDRRKTCSGGDQGTADAACDNGAVDDGPCDGMAEALLYDIETDNRTIDFMCRMDNPIDGGTIGPGQTSFGPLRVNDVTTDVCQTNGKDVTLALTPPSTYDGGQWLFSDPTIDYSTDTIDCWPIPSDFIVSSRQNKFNYNWQNIFVMPVNWYGRNSANNDFDCLSGSDPDIVDEESVCDNAPMVGATAQIGGGFQGMVIALSSPIPKSALDGNSLGLDVAFHDSTVTDHLRGLVADGFSNPRNLTFRRIMAVTGTAAFPTLTSAINSFSGYTHWSDLFFEQVYAEQLININAGRGRVIENVRVNASYTPRGWISDRGSVGTLMRQWRGEGNSGPILSVFPQAGGVTKDFKMQNVTALAQSLGQTAGNHTAGDVRGAVLFADQNSDDVYENISITGLHVESIQDDACLLFLSDEDTDTSGTTAADSSNQISLRDSSIDSGNSAKPICVTDDWNGSPVETALTEVGINAYRSPSVHDVIVNGVPWPDSGPRSQSYATVPDCGDLRVGEVVRIHDDSAANACTDGGDGILDGNSTFESVCICTSAGTWTSAI